MGLPKHGKIINECSNHNCGAKCSSPVASDAVAQAIHAISRNTALLQDGLGQVHVDGLQCCKRIGLHLQHWGPKIP